jgi:hypothetical protein
LKRRFEVYLLIDSEGLQQHKTLSAHRAHRSSLKLFEVVAVEDDEVRHPRNSKKRA